MLSYPVTNTVGWVSSTISRASAGDVVALSAGWRSKMTAILSLFPLTERAAFRVEKCHAYALG